VTPIFLHIGIVHLAFNSYAIYVIGPQIERFFGTARFLCIYILSGAYGVLASFALSPNLSAGASGAIFGLIGAQAAFFYRYRKAFGWRGQRQFQNTLSVIVFNLIMTFTAAGIDIWGHIGGLLAGVVLGGYLMPRYKVVTRQNVPELIDDSAVRQWGIAALAALVLLSIGLAGTIVVKRMLV
jgi:rhomboid protease GluP